MGEEIVHHCSDGTDATEAEFKTQCELFLMRVRSASLGPQTLAMES
jgi:hypothetical protein